MTFLQLDIPLQFRLSKIKEKKIINESSKKRKDEKVTQSIYHSAPRKHMPTGLVLSGISNSISLCSFTTVFGTTVEIASASRSLVFFISNELVKMILKTMGWKKAYKDCFISQK